MQIFSLLLTHVLLHSRKHFVLLLLIFVSITPLTFLTGLIESMRFVALFFILGAFMMKGLWWSSVLILIHLDPPQCRLYRSPRSTASSAWRNPRKTTRIIRCANCCRCVSFLFQCLTIEKFVGVGRDDGVTAGEYSPILYRKHRFALISTMTFWLSEEPTTPGCSFAHSLVYLESNQVIPTL